MTQYIDIIFFALLAVFLFFKLRNVIGEAEEETIKKEENNNQDSRSIPNKMQIKSATASASVVDALKAMSSRDSSFDAQDFIVSVKEAFKIIINAYAIGDRNTLRMLLSPELFKRFENDIKERERKGEVLQITIQEYKSIQITDVDVRENHTKIEVVIEVEEIVFSKDLKGKIVDGNENDVDVTKNIWTFEKQANNEDPTWFLVETRTDDEEQL